MAQCYDREYFACQLVTIVGQRPVIWCWNTTGEYIPSKQNDAGESKSETQCGRLQGDPDIFKPKMAAWFAANGFTPGAALAALKKLGAGSPCGDYIIDEGVTCGEH